MSAIVEKFSGKGKLIAGTASRTVNYEFAMAGSAARLTGHGEVVGRFKNLLPLERAQAKGEKLTLQLDDGRLVPVDVHFTLGMEHSFRALEAPREG